MRLQNCRKQEQAYAVLVMPLRSLSSQPLPPWSGRPVYQLCSCLRQDQTVHETSLHHRQLWGHHAKVPQLHPRSGESCDCHVTVMWCHMMSQDIYNTHSFFHTYSTICGHIHTDNFEIEPTCTVGLYWPGSSLTATNLVGTYMIDNHGSQRFWTDFEGRAWGQEWLL